jgi:hypothetical protein
MLINNSLCYNNSITFNFLNNELNIQKIFVTPQFIKNKNIITYIKESIIFIKNNLNYSKDLKNKMFSIIKKNQQKDTFHNYLCLTSYFFTSIFIYSCFLLSIFLLFIKYTFYILFHYKVFFNSISTYANGSALALVNQSTELAIPVKKVLIIPTVNQLHNYNQNFIFSANLYKKNLNLNIVNTLFPLYKNKIDKQLTYF